MQLPVFFFLTCDQQVSFFSGIGKLENFFVFWGSIFAKEISPARAKHVREQSSLRVNFVVKEDLESNAINTGLLLGTKIFFVPNHRLRATSSSVLLSSVVFILLVLNILITIEGY